MIRGTHHSEETRKRMSESQKGLRPSLETRKRMSESHKGLRPSLEARERMSKWQRGELGNSWRGDEAGREAQHKRVLQRIPDLDGIICEICNKNPATDRMRADATLLPLRDEYVILGCHSCNTKHESGALSITFVNLDDDKSYCAFNGELLEVVLGDN